MDEWKERYPTRDSNRDRNGNPLPWPFLGYLSEMVNLSLVRDDPEGFVGWMRESGLGRDARTFDNLSMEAYCKKRGAVKCLDALYKLD